MTRRFLRERLTLQTSGISVSLDAIEQLDDGSLSYELRGDRIVVTIIDRHSDAHILTLDHRGVSRKEALRLLAAKKAELETR
jgi:hypothetical protein